MQTKLSINFVFLRCLARRVKASTLYTFALGAIVFLFASSAQANMPGETEASDTQAYTNPSAVKQGTLLFKSEAGFMSAPTLHTDVRFTVTGMLVRAHVKQRFQNPDGDWKEGVYVFPLPEDAAVDHMRMYIGERIIEGQIKEKQKARKEYQQAKQSGKKASLVEQERPNVFTTSVANIAPHETIVVEIEYQQVARYDAGRFNLRFPLVVAPRYIPGNSNIRVEGFAGTGWATNTDQVPDATRISPPVRKPEQGSINPVNIEIDLNAGFKLDHIDSPYHDIAISNQENNYRIHLKEGDVPADRDFVLSWQPATGKMPQAAFFKENKNGDDYALLMVLPPQQAQSQVLNREVVFVIDTSGSMGGTSIMQAKAALELALNSLKTGDRFNIIQFDSHTSQLYPASQAVLPSTLQQARRYIGTLEAQGGTEMAPALHAALMQQNAEQGVRQVIFLTDGNVGNEDALFKIIEDNLLNSRLFTIGIGSAPNSHFMSRAAKFGRGTHTHIGNIYEVQQKMTDLFQKLENPVLRDIKISWPDRVIVESWPQRIPDLYLGEPLLVSAKAGHLAGDVKMTGRIVGQDGAGQDWQANLSLNGGKDAESISVLWARRKIAALMERSVRGNEADHIREEIIETALAHHLVSKYTSLIAVDTTPARKLAEILKRRALSTNLPAGWEYKKVFGTMPKTATPAGLYLLLGGFLLIISLFRSLFRNVYLKKCRSLFVSTCTRAGIVNRIG